jgi:hypothetical protein
MKVGKTRKSTIKSHHEIHTNKGQLIIRSILLGFLKKSKRVNGRPTNVYAHRDLDTTASTPSTPENAEVWWGLKSWQLIRGTPLFWSINPMSKPKDSLRSYP